MDRRRHAVARKSMLVTALDLLARPSKGDKGGETCNLPNLGIGLIEVNTQRPPWFLIRSSIYSLATTMEVSHQ